MITKDRHFLLILFAVTMHKIFYRNLNLNAPHPPTTTLSLKPPPVQRIHFWHSIKRNKSLNIHLHKETQRPSKREIEIEGEEDRRGERERERRRESSTDREAWWEWNGKGGGGAYRHRERDRRKQMQIFSLELLKRWRKDPSSSQLPNVNLQMPLCLLSSGTGAPAKCFIWHWGPGGLLAGIWLSLAQLLSFNSMEQKQAGKQRQ